MLNSHFNNSSRTCCQQSFIHEGSAVLPHWWGVGYFQSSLLIAFRLPGKTQQCFCLWEITKPYFPMFLCQRDNWRKPAAARMPVQFIGAVAALSKAVIFVTGGLDCSRLWQHYYIRHFKETIFFTFRCLLLCVFHHREFTLHQCTSTKSK